MLWDFLPASFFLIQPLCSCCRLSLKVEGRQRGRQCQICSQYLLCGFPWSASASRLLIFSSFSKFSWCLCGFPWMLLSHLFPFQICLRSFLGRLALPIQYLSSFMQMVWMGFNICLSVYTTASQGYHIRFKSTTKVLKLKIQKGTFGGGHVCQTL